MHRRLEDEKIGIVWLMLMALEMLFINLLDNLNIDFLYLFFVVLIFAETLILSILILKFPIKKNNWWQIEIVCILQVFFIVPALLNCYEKIVNKLFVISYLLCMLCVCMVLLVNNWKIWAKNISHYIFINKYFMYGIIFVVLIRLPQWGTVTRWDGQIYSYCLSDACQNIDFTLKSFIRYFKIADHTSWGYIFLASLIEAWKPFGKYTLSIFGMIMSVWTYWAIYELFRNFTRKKRVLCTLAALCVTMTPIFAGTYTYFNLDYGVACLYFIVLVLYFKDYRLLSFLFSLCLCLTKEPVGIILVTGILIYNFLENCKGGILFGDGIKRNLQDVRNYYYTGSILICLIGFIINRIQNKDSVFGLVEAENSINSFTIDLEYIGIKSLQLLFLNFTWILVLIMFFLTIKLLKKKSRLDRKIWAILGGIVGYLVFMNIYKTYPVPRYNIVTYMVLSFVACNMILLAIKSVKLKKNLLSILTLIFCVQTYIDIDLVSKLVYPQVYTGKYLISNTSITENYLGDYTVYNYMYSYFDNLILEILSDAEYDGNQNIVLLGEDTDSFIGGNKQLAPIYYNPVEKEWSYINSAETMYVESLPEEDLYKRSAEIVKEIIVVIMPCYDIKLEEEEKRILQEYDILKKEKVDTRYGKAEYWSIKRKNEN